MREFTEYEKHLHAINKESDYLQKHCPSLLEHYLNVSQIIGEYRKELTEAKAEVERLKMELNEQYVDENDTAWRRPSAEAYYLACKARRKAEAMVTDWQDVAEQRLESHLVVTQKVCRLEAENAKLRKIASAAKIFCGDTSSRGRLDRLCDALLELDEEGEIWLK